MAACVGVCQRQGAASSSRLCPNRRRIHQIHGRIDPAVARFGSISTCSSSLSHTFEIPRGGWPRSGGRGRQRLGATARWCSSSSQGNALAPSGSSSAPPRSQRWRTMAEAVRGGAGRPARWRSGATTKMARTSHLLSDPTTDAGGWPQPLPFSNSGGRVSPRMDADRRR
jgi:hypothetical protein